MNEFLAVLVEIEKALTRITESDIQRIQRDFAKINPKERALGTLHSEGLKRLWALAVSYEAQAAQAVLDAQYRATSEEHKEELVQLACRLKALEGVIRELFWFQANDDIGGWNNSASVGIREDWMLVALPERQHPLATLLGGIVRQE
jgi:hypothetical protein